MPHFFTNILPLIFALSFSAFDVAAASCDGKILVGQKEWVKIDLVDQVVKARVDTGAATSSISAIDIQPITKNDQDWVSFKLIHDNLVSENIILPVERTVKIRQASRNESERRFVVKLPITIGACSFNREFTLRDRQHLTYPVLLGRNYLKHGVLVDVSEAYIQGKPDTKEKATPTAN